MTVLEMREALAVMDEDMPVLLTYDITCRGTCECCGERVYVTAGGDREVTSVAALRDSVALGYE
ncbi:MAG: hypothetical protein FWF49_02280 [Oscillospiraceae bacterium]|nr:hypothetical protein [Oscillospiraceae bacterium]